jgi:hypothetical protein
VNGIDREEEVIGRRSSGHLILSVYSHDLLRTHLNLGAVGQILMGIVLISGAVGYLSIVIDEYRAALGHLIYR